eukprot:TRINITY_DN53370_c0_g1_i2.p1 TRINITY_DN53370_c0_g1~~TRINITY_DN53370_c0_g1_i2.p1  ORF type:complete len:105 (-),score=9.68 TRINITY_DN53370_c0_g1_i2:45-359(-)
MQSLKEEMKEKNPGRGNGLNRRELNEDYPSRFLSRLLAGPSLCFRSPTFTRQSRSLPSSPRICPFFRHKLHKQCLCRAFEEPLDYSLAYFEGANVKGIKIKHCS